MIEEAIADANDESEQTTGWLTMIDEHLAVPFETTVLGVPVTVERVDLDASGQIVAICRRGRHRQALPIRDLPLPLPPPEGSEWIAFLDLANWGTHVLKLRLPARLLDAKTARSYCAGGRASVRKKNGKVILTFVSEDEEGGGWVEGASRLSSLISARAELRRGDLRALYLGWLLCVQSGNLDDEDVEPPVPAGLAGLSAPLESFAEFLRVDADLVRVAAAASPPIADSETKSEDVRG